MQQPRENLSGGLVVQALSGDVVVGADAGGDLVVLDKIEVGFARQISPEAADSVFDAALLPRGVRFTEVGSDSRGGVEPVVFGELGPVVEGKGSAQSLRQGAEKLRQDVGGGFGLSVRSLDQGGEAAGAFMQDEHVLAVG